MGLIPGGRSLFAPLSLLRMPRSAGHETEGASPMNPSANITSVLKETRVFPPPKEFALQAHVKSPEDYQKMWQWAHDDPDSFWAKQAESLDWFTRWTKILEWKEPHSKWFVGGTLNASYN